MTVRRRVHSTRARETGFSLTELLLVLTLMSIVGGVVATAFVVSVRGNDRVQAALPVARDANALDSWLASDISSAVPVDANWLSIDPAAATGCASTPAGTVNVLRIATRNPIKPNATAETYSANYRYSATTKSLWRVFCRAGQAPSSNTDLVTDIDPAFPPVPSTTPAKDSARITFKVIGRGVSTQISARAAIRVPALTPTISTSTTTTLVPKIACAYSSGSAQTPPFMRVAASGNNPRALANSVTISVTSNFPAGAGCTQLIAQTNGLTCPLTGAGTVWSAVCWGPGTPATWRDGYSVVIADRIDIGDVNNPPTDVAIVGPAISFTVL